MVERNELTADEWQWLMRMHRRDAAFLTVAMGDRLEQLGLAEQKLGGLGLSKDGRELVAKELAPAMRARRREREAERKRSAAQAEHQRLMGSRRGR